MPEVLQYFTGFQILSALMNHLVASPFISMEPPTDNATRLLDLMRKSFSRASTRGKINLTWNTNIWPLSLMSAGSDYVFWSKSHQFAERPNPLRIYSRTEHTRGVINIYGKSQYAVAFLTPPLRMKAKIRNKICFVPRR